MHHGHDPLLMGLSILIAVQGSFVSLVLARETGQFEGAWQRLVLAMSAVTLGSSIWAMHFIGMLAYHMPIAVSYDLFLTLLSFLVAVLAVGIGYGITTVFADSTWRDVAAALFTGGGIAGMHYIGMAALSGPVELGYHGWWVIASILIGVVAAGISLHLAFGTKLQARAALGAVAMGLAISGMHYSAMYGTEVMSSDQNGTALPHALDRTLLAIVVAIVAFIICATSMLLLIPSRRSAPRGDDLVGHAQVTSLERWEDHGHDGLPAVPAGPLNNRMDMGRIPARSGGSTVLLDPLAIHAVRADGRYTHLQDGGRDYFCNLSITDLAGKLDPAYFLRVHRSHIVQVRYVKALRRKGDGAVLTMAGRSGAGRSELAIPVSRSALPKLKARLGLADTAITPPLETSSLS
ncbi:MAG TPA: MHYT domain-containing protein [Dongiaceae bacterium]|nr:MHYT domain-containing protein [Dongiaceae bacterium]